MEWYIKVLQQYADFNGRARRKEYWMFTLVNIIIWAIFQILSMALGGVTMATTTALALLGISVLYSLAVLIPGLAVSVRRLHDTGRSGWWILINFVPLIGAIVFIVFMIQDSDVGTNQYGANPKGVGVGVEA